MKNFFSKNMFLILIAFTTTQLFSAGAHLSIAPYANIKSVVCRLNIESLPGMTGQSPLFSINKGATVDYDTSPQFDVGVEIVTFGTSKIGPGLIGIEWREFLEQPDANGNTSINYTLTLPSKIEGIEGWRDWKFLGGGKIDIGGWALNKAFGTLQGTQKK